MTNPENAFKRRLLSGRTQIGGWCMSGSATLAEAMSVVGYDYLVLDLEHSPTTVGDALAMLRAVAQTSTLPVVRLASHDPVAVKQVMDIGAQTLCFPFVESREEAEAIVTAAMYPPRGRRGFAKMHRASRYATRGDYLETANDNACLIAQLETPSALELAPEIGAVDGIDALFIGPGDLSAAMGLAGRVSHPEVRASMETCAKRSRDAHIPIGTMMPTPEDGRWALEAGFSFVSVGTDLATLMSGCREQWRDMQAPGQSKPT